MENFKYFELLTHLDATKSFNGATAKWNQKTFSSMIQRKIGLEWLHLGETDVRVKDLENELKMYNEILAPRSGHIGNWGDISQGRAGLVDYNKVICFEKQIGYPLLYLFNQTEDQLCNQGDSIYLPGSIVESGKPTPLPLFTYDGHSFVPRDRSVSYFTPFVMTNHQGKMQSLISYHFAQFKKISDFNYVSEAELAFSEVELLKKSLRILLSEALFNPRNQEFLPEIFSHVVTKDGQVSRAEIRMTDNKIFMNGFEFENLDELIEASQWPIKIAAQPSNLAEHIQLAPPAMPLRGAMFTNLWSGLRNYHIKPEFRQEICNQSPISVHLHWGAVGMAGYPPYKRGYFGNKDKIKAAKWMAKLIVNYIQEIKPCFFVLMPVAPYFLTSMCQYKDDSKILNELFLKVIDQTRDMTGDPSKMMDTLKPIVKDWMNGSGSQMSSYFKSKFSEKRSVASKLDLPSEKGFTIYTESFYELTFRQACILTGLLMEFASTNGW